MGWKYTLPNQACLVKHWRRRVWLDESDKTERPHSYTDKQHSGHQCLDEGGEISDRAGGGLCSLNANDVFQGGMCKEYTALMR